MHVCLYGLALARAAGIGSSHERADFGTGLLLHDIGKLSLPSDLTNGEGEPSEEDWELIRQHPRRGLEKVEGIEWIGKIARGVILDHHRHLDGGGYPDGEGEISPFTHIARSIP